MAEHPPSRHDFIAETKGHCFLCSNKIYSRSPAIQVDSDASASLLAKCSSSTYSLNCLSRYLKLDMRKVFTGDGPIPPDLVAKVEKAGLRAELCEGCSILTQKLSKQVRLLEKIEMEVNYGLESVCEKLQRALKPGNNSSNDNLKFDEWSAKLEITDALRKDAVEKCSRKLAALHPLTKLKRLTPKKVLYEKVKLRKAFAGCRQGTKQRSEDVDVGSPAIDVASNEQGNDHDHQDEQDYYDPDPTPSPPILGQKYEIDAEDVKHEVMEDTANDIEVDDVSERQQSTSNNESRAVELTDAIPPPIKVSSEVGDSTTKSTASKKQKNRFVCSECKKDFNSNAHYQRHYLSVHMGVKYKCSECDKTFAQKIHLVYHQKGAHLGNPIQCKYCPRIFSRPNYKNQHMKLCPARKNVVSND